MYHPSSAAAALISLSLLIGCTSTSSQPRNLSFDTQLLTGWWSDNASTAQACTKENPRIRFVFGEDGEHLVLQFDRKWDTEIGESDKFGAKIVSATDRTLVIQYDGESRLDPAGKPNQWELAVVAPGVYRWRATEWRAGTVNAVVGVKCSG